MGLGDILKRLFGGGGEDPGRFDTADLARRLGMEPEALQRVRPAYQAFDIPKRSGGRRRILAPEAEFKAFQRRLLRRLLARLSAHEAAHGFERGRSIVTHARRHTGSALLLRLDIRDFFPSTGAARVEAFFRQIGWDRKAASLLTTFCTHDGGLPQGAPTSPRLSNLVNRRLDARLEGLATRLGANYSRYADDMSFSWKEDRREQTGHLIGLVGSILEEEGYHLHRNKKLRIMRGNNRQVVTGLVVNKQVNLPRKTRRWLRAVEHRRQSGRHASLTAEQLDGWQSLVRMIEKQRRVPSGG